MGMYGDILNKLDDSLYVKITPGKATKLRVLDHPWISQKQFIDGTTGESRIVTQFHWPVWDYAQSRVRILTQGKSVFKQIAGACETWPAGDTMPSPFDIVVNRTGTGPYDTEYDVQAIPYSGTMPRIAAVDLPNMQEKSGGIPVQQVMAGKTAPVLPPTVGRGGTPPVAAPKRPTAADAAALDAPPASSREPEPEGADTVITDLDTETEIDFDGIPDSDDSTTPPLERPEFLQ